MARRALATALAAIAILTGTAVAQTPVVDRHPVYGGVEATFGTCPADDPPRAGTVCVENYVIAFHGYALLSGGSLSPVKRRSSRTPRPCCSSSPGRMSRR